PRSGEGEQDFFCSPSPSRGGGGGRGSSTPPGRRQDVYSSRRRGIIDSWHAGKGAGLSVHPRRNRRSGDPREPIVAGAACRGRRAALSCRDNRAAFPLCLLRVGCRAAIATLFTGGPGIVVHRQPFRGTGLYRHTSEQPYGTAVALRTDHF